MLFLQRQRLLSSVMAIFGMATTGRSEVWRLLKKNYRPTLNSGKKKFYATFVETQMSQSSLEMKAGLLSASGKATLKKICLIALTLLRELSFRKDEWFARKTCETGDDSRSLKKSLNSTRSIQFIACVIWIIPPDV